MKIGKSKIWTISLAGILFFGQLFLAVMVRATVTTSTAGNTTVTATVPAAEEEGGGGGTNPSADTTAPAAVSDLTVSSAVGNTITLTWTAVGDDGNTGTASAYLFRYSTSGYINTELLWDQATEVINSLVPTAAGTTQTFAVSGLVFNTQYYFVMKVRDDAGNWSSISNSPSGKIIAVADTTPPVISNIQVTNITASSATVSWTTNENATSTVPYGTSVAYGLGTLSSSQLITSHSFDLTNLQEKTLYHFQIKCSDASGNLVVSSDQTFTTLETTPPPDTTPPEISNVVATPHATYVVITWTTNEVADSQVAYGLTDALGTIKSVEGLRTSHSVTVGSSAANTKYYYAVRSTDEAGNQGASAVADFTTLTEVTPPANVSGLVATAGNQQATLRWQNPSDADFAGVVIRRSTSGFPQNTTDGIQVYSGTVAEHTDTGLTNGVLYYYTVFAFDTSGNYSSGAVVSVTPTTEIITPPIIGPPVEPPPVVPPGGGIGSITTSTISGLTLADLELFTARHALRVPLSNGVAQVLSGLDLTVSFDPTKTSRTLQNLTLRIGESTYLMVSDRFGKYSADVAMPTAPGRYGAKVTLNFKEGSSEELNFIIEIIPGGWVYTVKNGERVPVSEAEVGVYYRNAAGAWELWNADAYHQSNPQKTGERGGYGWAAPNGNYYLRINHGGYRVQETGLFSVSNQIINLGVELLAIPPPLQIDSELSVAENVQEVAKNLGQKTVFAAKIIGQELKKEEVKKAVEQTAAPVVTGAAVVGTAAAAGTQILNYLRFLFTQPLLFFFKRKRKGWGIVYNSLTKMPVDLAIVRLVEATTSRVMQSRVTDKEGRYAFIAVPGSYRLEINQDQFVFPTKFLTDLKEDGKFLDIYHGEVIEVKEQGALITANIPLDPVGAEKPAGLILRRLFFRKLQNVVSAVSILVSIAFVYITPGWLTGGLLAVQVLSYILFRRLSIPPKPKSWGIVYDEHDKRPLTAVVARIFDKQYNKLLETQITDAKGRYSFLVGRNEYYITYEKDKYEKKTSAPIDLRQHPEPSTTVGMDTGLKKVDLEGKNVAEKKIEPPTVPEIKQ